MADLRFGYLPGFRRLLASLARAPRAGAGGEPSSHPSVEPHRQGTGPEVRATAPAPAPAALTRRQRQALALLAEGMTNKEIGVAMRCSEGTAKNHLHNAYDRIGAHTRVEAALLAASWRQPA